MKNETIVDRVVERLKAQPLGDLITEEDLHEIVKQAVPKAFFEERPDPNHSGYGRAPIIEPRIVSVMRELLRDSAKEAVAAYLKEHPEIIAEYWKKVCDAGLVGYVEEIMSSKATESLKMALRPWVQQINDERAKMGLPTLSIYF